MGLGPQTKIPDYVTRTYAKRQVFSWRVLTPSELFCNALVNTKGELKTREWKSRDCKMRERLFTESRSSLNSRHTSRR